MSPHDPPFADRGIVPATRASSRAARVSLALAVYRDALAPANDGCPGRSVTELTRGDSARKGPVSSPRG